MMHHECENLDAFLADELPAESVGLFVAHLAECDGCRDAVDQQRWIDCLLRSPLRQELEAPPAAAAVAVRASIVQRRRRVRLVASGLAAAAAIVVAVGWAALWDASFGGEVEQHTLAVRHDSEPSPGPSLEGRGIEREPSLGPSLPGRGIEPPRATFVGGPDVLVVPVKSSHPNVTVVRVYPTYQPSYSIQASADQPVGGRDYAWPNDLNGG